MQRDSYFDVTSFKVSRASKHHVTAALSGFPFEVETDQRADLHQAPNSVYVTSGLQRNMLQICVSHKLLFWQGKLSSDLK